MIYQGTTSQILDHENSWIGSIPSSWKIVRLQRYLYLQNGYPFDSTHFNSFEGIRLVRIRDLTDGGTETYFDGQVPSHSLIDDGDLLVGMDGDFNVCWWQGGKAVLNQRLCCLHSLVGLDKRFLFYLLPWPLKIINDLTYFTTVKHLSSSQILKIKAPLPSLDEQRYIAAYLDRKTDVIDSVIQKKQRLIELLREKRQALITQAVTKGLDPSVPMKGSGIEWLGEIPQHWAIGRLGADCSIKARLGWKGLKASEYVDDGFVFLSTPNIKGNDIDFDNVNYVTEQRYYESPEIMLQKGDVLIAKDGSTLGITNVIRALPAKATVNSSIAVIRPRGAYNSVFLYYFLSAHYTQSVIQRMKDGMGVPHLFQADLRKFVTIIPPLNEQNAIATYLDQTTKMFDKLIDHIDLQIARVEEYRQTLISAAVTGKIDVREEVAACL
ncbi:MAG: restriction endonuclease subunit S [Methanothrix sp.]|nr:restriction endonuclease subunit S [Methanothrix sp.]